MYACVKGQERIVQMLFDHGADPEVLDEVHTMTATAVCCN